MALLRASVGEVERSLRQALRARQGASIAHMALWLALITLLLTACTTILPTAAPSARIGKPLIAHPAVESGCGRPLALLRPGTSAYETLFSGGLLRRYLLHLPRGYQDTVPQPLVLNFHGHGSNALQQEARTAFSLLADQHDFVVAYPQGVIGPDHRSGWATGPAKDPRVNDVGFVGDLLTHLQSTLCIDSQRIYATGFSNGGGMTNMLACTMADRIAAFAPVSGSYPPLAQGCHPARPVPILEFHGTADTVVPYAGNNAGDPPIVHWLAGWATLDGCTKGPETFFKANNVTGEQWTNCQGGAVVLHYRITGAGHVWPLATLRGRTHAGNPPYSIDASSVIWSFFQAHPLQVEKSPATRPMVDTLISSS